MPTMPVHADRIDFAPPAQPGMVRALGLAILAHLILVAALTWGVNWKSENITLSAEAELWASVPQSAAPKLVEPPPAAKPPAPVPVPKPTIAAKQPEASDNTPDIVQEKAKPPPKPAKLPEPLPPPPQKPKLEPKPEPKPATTPEPAKPKPDTAAQNKLRANEEAKRLEDERAKNLERIAGLAGGTGGPRATGTAPQSAGMSQGYAGRIAARIKPNIVFTGSLPDNPRVEVEIKAAPDGTILGRPRITKSSGSREWDEAVVRAIEKTEILPRDTDGRVPSTIPLSARPNDFN